MTDKKQWTLFWLAAALVSIPGMVFSAWFYWRIIKHIFMGQ